MAYFLGRDVHAAITTEHDVCGISVVAESGKAFVDNVLIATAASVDASTEIITTDAAHGLTTGDPVNITMDATQTPTGGLTDTGNRYFANAVAGSTLMLYDTYANAVAGSSGGKVNITNTTNITNVNITRELSTGTNDPPTASPNTFIRNRSHPKYGASGDVGNLALIVADSSTPEGIEQTTAAYKNTITDLVGIDITTGAIDEDVSYFGQRTPLKAEIKKESYVTFTMKKSDNRFEVLYNKARDGVLTYTTSSKTAFDVDSAVAIAASTLPNANAAEVNNGNPTAKEAPSRNFGYRIHLMLKTGAEVITLQNCCITDYGVSLNSDGIQEETITFYGYVKPVVTAAAIGYITASTAAEL